MFLRRDIKEVFDISVPDAGKMDGYIQTWYNITGGNPPWADADDDIKSINFAQFIDDVTSGLVTLDIGISLPRSPRGQYLQRTVNYALQKLDNKISDALGNAGVMFKPNGENVDYFTPGWFLPTSWDSNGNINGCMFIQREVIGNKYYTKYEYHRFERTDEGRIYVISNRAYMGNSENDKGKPVELNVVPSWAGLQPDTYLLNVDRPLFAYYGNPKPNIIDRSSPLSTPIWLNCIEELRDLDIAWSRKSAEIEDSKHVTYLPETAIRYAEGKGEIVPRFVKGLQSSNPQSDTIHEHNATLLTTERIADINATLAMISTKLGYDQGFFVLNERTGRITATQVEADDQSTIRTIKNLRDPLRDSMLQLIYAINVFADLYTNLPVEAWTANYDTIAAELGDAFNFGDITYSYEEDKASWWKYRLQGDIPPWMFYAKFEGMSEDEAKKMNAQAQTMPVLFGEEE